MIGLIKEKLLLSKFKKKFIQFNSHTLKAFKIKSDEKLKEHCWKCARAIAEENNKDIKSASLEDIYRALHKVRRKSPDFLRKVTLYQMEGALQSASKVSHGFNAVYSLVCLTPVPLMFAPLKRVLGQKIKYVMIAWLVSFMAQEIYGGGAKLKSGAGEGKRQIAKAPPAKEPSIAKPQLYFEKLLNILRKGKIESAKNPQGKKLEIAKAGQTAKYQSRIKKILNIWRKEKRHKEGAQALLKGYKKRLSK